YRAEQSGTKRAAKFANRAAVTRWRRLKMNPTKGIVFKLISAFLFAVMSALVRYLGVHSPLFSVALAALILSERVRVYRWSAVIIGFVGVLVVLSPHVSDNELSIAMAEGTSLIGIICAIGGALTNAGTVIQTRRLAKSETTSSIVFYFSLCCALAGL